MHSRCPLVRLDDLLRPSLVSVSIGAPLSLLRRLLFRTFVVAVCLAGSAVQSHAEDSIESLVRAADDEQDNLKGFELILRAVQVDERTRELDREKRTLVRAHLVSRGLKAVMAVKDDDPQACRVALRIVTGLQPYRPSTQEVGSGDAEGRFAQWPALLLMLSVCHSHAGHDGLARPPYEDAVRLRAHLQSKDRESLRSAYHMAKSNLSVSDPFRVGAYVTNTGLLQAWIGRIVEGNGDSVRVRTTYTANGEGVGEVRTVSRRDAKPLTSVSIEALLRGWE